MLFHSCRSLSRSSCSVFGGFYRWRTGLPSSSHKCAIVDRSANNVGQGRTRMWFSFIKSWQTRTTWHLALSCWKTWSKFRYCRMIGLRRSSLYFTAFNVPWTILSWMRPSWQIPSQTITPPPPKLVGLVHTLVRKTCPTPAVHTITSIAKTKWKSGFITKKDVLAVVKLPTIACTNPG